MIHLLARCGIGDIISHLSRIKNIKEVHNDDKVKFWIGGYNTVPQLCKSILEHNNIECEIVNGWKDVQQNELVKQFISKKIDKNDKLIDLNFEIDIFNNKIPSFYKYKMEFPTKFVSDLMSFSIPSIKDEFLNYANVIGIHAKTKIGAPDFDHGGQRFWSDDNWKKLIQLLNNKGYRVAIFGSESDKLDIQETGLIKSYCGKLSVLETIAAIKSCKRFIGTNSWMWEVSAFSNIPTVCLYFTNTFFTSLHIPFEYSEIHKNLFIETDCTVIPEKVIDYFNLDTNIKISACVITQDESQLLDKCLSNLNGYVDEIVVIDGGSKDNSIEIARKYTDKIFTRIFDNHMNQKNFAIENASNDWILIQDTDETYEYGFLNNMKRYITANSNIDLFLVPRINIIEDLDEELIRMYNFNIHPFFKWINYPDLQERLFRKELRHSVHPVHHHLVGYKNTYIIKGFHSIHIKNKEKQIYQNERYKVIEKKWKEIK